MAGVMELIDGEERGAGPFLEPLTRGTAHRLRIQGVNQGLDYSG